jgi:hypothetical protein
VLSPGRFPTRHRYGVIGIGLVRAGLLLHGIAATEMLLRAGTTSITLSGGGRYRMAFGCEL